MSFTKSTIERLLKIFGDKADEIGRNRVEWTSIGGPISQTEHEWHSLMASLGVTEISRDDLLGDCERFQGKVLIDNPRMLQGYGYLLVPRDLAEKAVVMGCLPEEVVTPALHRA